MTGSMPAQSREQVLARILLAERELQRLAACSFDPTPVPPELTIRQFQVLLLLRSGPESTGAALAESLGVSTATISGVVDRLASGGWLSRRQDPSDRRRVLLTLTGQSEDMLASLESPALQLKEVILQRLDDAELADLARLLRRLTQVGQELLEPAHDDM